MVMMWSDIITKPQLEIPVYRYVVLENVTSVMELGIQVEYGKLLEHELPVS